MTNSKEWKQKTRLVHEGQNRSPYGETAEAMYLTSGYVYETAEQSEARFTGEDPGFVYSRYGNPTVSVFEDRLALLEGAEKCFATASGMGAVSAAILCQLKAGDHIVAARALAQQRLHIRKRLIVKLAALGRATAFALARFPDTFAFIQRHWPPSPTCSPDL